ncbi:MULTISPECIES: type II toxin-antitoxin system RelE/ParE family toxin [unclassified Maridesulfovibrio]|uniref:type II toxin-antitoxin system RelE/ParE family toxin n=1 Tax=unclassified Maridesulfovibrio TaxID=2794999 RepID=UPI003B3FD6F1
MAYRVVFAPEFESQILDLFRYLKEVESLEVAADYTNAIIDYCASLAEFPMRGTARDDIRPGLRITHYKKRAIIAFAVLDDKVSILGIFYGGQNYEGKLS